jgi:hypothetical protein
MSWTLHRSRHWTATRCCHEGESLDAIEDERNRLLGLAGEGRSHLSDLQATSAGSSRTRSRSFATDREADLRPELLSGKMKGMDDGDEHRSSIPPFLLWNFDTHENPITALWLSIRPRDFSGLVDADDLF